MNEEITVNMGLNVEGFGVGIRKSKQHIAELKQAASGVGEMFKKGLEIAGISFAAAAFVEAGKKIIEYGAHIAETAENIGVSGEFLQQFGFAAKHTASNTEAATKGLSELSKNIGEARSGSDEAAKKFDKWNISLQNADGSARSVQEVAEAVAQAIEEISDPAIRNAMAFDLMGKSGKQLVGALASLKEAKEASKGKIITESELDTLKDAQKSFTNLGQTAMTWGAKALAPWLRVFAIAGDPLVNRLKNMQAPGDAAAFDVTTTKEYIKELEKLRQARLNVVKETSGDFKSIVIKDEIKDIQAQINAIQGDSVDKVKLQISLEEKQLELNKEIARVSKKDAEDKKKREHEALEDKRKIAQMQHEINQAEKTVTKDIRKLDETKAGRSQLTVAELANSWLRYQGQLGIDQRLSRQIQYDEQRGEMARQGGWLDDSKKWFDAADELRKQLSGNVREADRDPFRNMEEAVQDSEAHLKEILEKAKGEGINVVMGMSE